MTLAMNYHHPNKRSALNLFGYLTELLLQL